MIFIVGGAFQGKREFAAKMFANLNEANLNGAELNETDFGYLPEPEGIKGKFGEFADGGEVSWEVFRKAKYGCNLQLMIRRKLEEGEDAEELERTMAAQLIEGCPDRILLMDEIGYGIVPVDVFERQYRETAGRIGCKLAAEAREVWRVVAGMGMRLR